MIIQSKRVWLIDQFASLQLEIENDIIVAIHPYNTKAVDIDYKDLRIVPGFVDIHTHGGYGFDITHPDEASFKAWLDHLPAEGVTSILPTTLSAPVENLKGQLSFLKDQMDKNPGPVRLLGIHMEGPFLSPEYKGAQPEKALIHPDIELFNELMEISGNHLVLMSIAPEQPLADELIRYALKLGCISSIAHTSARYENCLLALANGARSFTHTYNAMSGFHHRNPGTVNAALRFEDVYGELIADGHHISDPAIFTFFASKKSSYAILVSDSLALKGLPAGSTGWLLDEAIHVSPKGVMELSNGTFAGSSLRLNESITICEQAGIPFAWIIRALSTNPAAMLGKWPVGVLQSLKMADFVVLDADNSVQATWISGRLCYQKEEEL